MTKHRYSKVAIKAADETPEKLREEFPKELINAYVAWKRSDYGEEEHAVYAKQARKFLGELANEAIEYGKLGVRLTRATYDLVEKKHEKEEKVKGKKPTRRKRALSKKRSYGEQKEEVEQAEMQGENQQ